MSGRNNLPAKKAYLKRVSWVQIPFSLQYIFLNNSIIIKNMIGPIDQLDNITYYINNIKKYPRLSEEEEFSYFKKYKENNCLESKNTIINCHLRFVVHIAKQYMGSNFSLLDLIQEGNVGLIKSMKNYDYTAGIRFVTYANHYIKAEILNFIKYNDIVPFCTTQSRRKIFFNRELVYDINGKVNDIKKTANKLNVSENDIKEFIKFNQPIVELYRISKDGDEELNHEVDDLSYDPIEDLIQHEEKQLILKKISCRVDSLNDRDKFIITHRIINEEKKTLKDLSEIYNISCERVRQLENHALKKIKDGITI